MALTADLKTKELTANEPFKCEWRLRQYSAIGTGTVTLQGSILGANWETFLTIAPGGATTLLSQRSADMYPFIKYTTTGTNTVWVMGLEG